MSGTGGVFLLRSERDLAPESVLDLVTWRGPVAELRRVRDWTVMTTGHVRVVRCGSTVAVVHGWIRDVPLAEAADHLAQLVDRVGRRALEEIDGGFAAVLLDESTGVADVRRDFMGTRPLFWGSSGSEIAVASEPIAVPLVLGRRPRPDESTAASYLARARPPVDATFLAGVRAVAPNATLTIAPNALVSRPGQRGVDRLGLDDRAAVTGVRTRLDEAVRVRTRDASRAAAQLSAGLDSGTVTAVGAAAGTIEAAFTHRVRGDDGWDETGPARSLASRHRIDHTVVEVDPLDTLRGVEDEILVHGPTHPTMWLSASTIRAAAAAGHDVILTGHLGDEWLTMAGGPLAQAAWERQIGPLRAFAAERVGDGVSRRTMGVVTARLLIGGVVRRRRYGRHVLSTFLNDAWLQRSLLALERLGSQSGIRIELPFADRTYVQFVLGLDAWQRNRPGIPKRILREACADLLPAEYVTEPIKANFIGVPEAALGGAFAGPEAWAEYRRRWLSSWRAALARI